MPSATYFLCTAKKVGKEIRSLKRREGLYNVQWQIGAPVVQDPGVQNRFGCYLMGIVSHGVVVWGFMAFRDPAVY